jgi:hypothetical protein
VSVLFTLVVLAAVGMWGLAVFRRLARQRDHIKVVWKRLEAEQENEAIRTVYNNHVTSYNAALESFPAYLIAPLAGLKPARHFQLNSSP